MTGQRIAVRGADASRFTYGRLPVKQLTSPWELLDLDALTAGSFQARICSADATRPSSPARSFGVSHIPFLCCPVISPIAGNSRMSARDTLMR